MIFSGDILYTMLHSNPHYMGLRYIRLLLYLTSLLHQQHIFISFNFKYIYILYWCGRGQLKWYRNWLRAEGSRPSGGEIFSSPKLPPKVHSTCCKIQFRIFLGVKGSWSMLLTTSPSSATVKKMYISTSVAPHMPSWSTFYRPLLHQCTEKMAVLLTVRVYIYWGL